jgi:hypothetical protein
MNNRRRTATAALAAGATALLLALACSDATGPSLSQRIPGTYDFTASLSTYYHAGPSDCSIVSGYTQCSTRTDTAGASKLYGTFAVGDTVPGTTTQMVFAVTGASMHQAECGASLTPCTEYVAQYYPGQLTLTRDSLELDATLSGGVQIILHGQFVDDHFVGTVQWSPYLGCCLVSRYSGTFVAQRRP